MATLTDGELLKKTLRTTLVMLASAAVWVGALSGAVIVVTAPSSSAATSETKVDKPASPALGGLPANPIPRGAAGLANPRAIHQSRPMSKPEPPHAGAGDPI